MKLSIASISLLLVLALAQSARAAPGAKRIDPLIGIKGALNTNEGVFKVTAPRTGVKISFAGWTMPPFTGLAWWAAFTEEKMGGANGHGRHGACPGRGESRDEGRAGQ